MIELTGREKKLLQILAVVLVLAFIYFFIIMPISNRRRESAGGVREKIESIAKIDRIYEEYRQVKQKKAQYMSQLGNRDANINSMIEQWAANAGVSSALAYTRSTQTLIQNKYTMVTTIMKFDGVAIEPLLKFIYEVENSALLLKISYIRMREAMKGGNTYDVELKINSYSLQ
ncbi:MAG: type II secretion system protein M [Spirochaetes bacterium]|nr:type II secretion system protein M [Spirochaetota bacterium]